MNPCLSLAALLLAATLGTPVAAEPMYDIVNLGGLGYGGTPEWPTGYSMPRALNNRGLVTLRSGDYSPGGLRDPIGLLWSRGQLIELGHFGSEQGVFSGTIGSFVNDAGQVAGDAPVLNKPWERYEGGRAFLWQDGRMTRIRVLVDGALPARFPAETYSSARGLSSSGQVVGMSTYFRDGVNLGLRAFSWQGGRLTNLGTPWTDAQGYGMSWANAVNDSGVVAGLAFRYENGVNKGPRPVVWTNGQARELEILGTDPEGRTMAAGVDFMNRQGTMTGLVDFWVDGVMRSQCAVIWSGGTLTRLGDLDASNPGGCMSTPTAINDRGQVVGMALVGTARGPFGNHGFLWDDGKMTDLGSLGHDAGGSSNSIALALNNHGVVVGEAPYYWPGSGEIDGNRGVVSFDGQPFQDLNDLVDPADRTLPVIISRAVAVNDRGEILAIARSAGSNESTPVLTQALLLVPRGGHHHHHPWHGCGRDDDDAARAKRGGRHCDR
ncbi:HAF repeat-containing protein [Derxia gummosa]|uniref:HAF repeat-containing protein n=1 Tax=Derxia gummosa DSM 723 TaxID=1121388 RepID=A0A8B6X2S6_9BURK|nr:HAF repeat-containing protein [Derxia gummosa]